MEDVLASFAHGMVDIEPHNLVLCILTFPIHSTRIYSRIKTLTQTKSINRHSASGSQSAEHIGIQSKRS